MAKINVTWLQSRDGHNAGDKGVVDDTAIDELMRTGQARWESVADAPPPAPPPPAPEPPKS